MPEHEAVACGAVESERDGGPGERKQTTGCDGGVGGEAAGMDHSLSPGGGAWAAASARNSAEARGGERKAGNQSIESISRVTGGRGDRSGRAVERGCGGADGGCVGWTSSTR